ncbi:MAG: MFS transporter [Hyphomicrobiales bacterium]
MSKKSIFIFVFLLAVTMLGEGMVTVGLLWTSARLGQSPFVIGVTLFVMNIVPFLAQFLFKPLRNAIDRRPLSMIVFSRIVGIPAALYAGLAISDYTLLSLVIIAAYLTFIIFISQQCIETLMGQLTIAGVLDADQASRLSQTAIQLGVFAGNALAGLLIAQFGTRYVFIAIAASFAASLLLLFFADAFHSAAHQSRAQPHDDGPENPSDSKGRRQILWILTACMGILAIQIGGFNFFVPLIYESRESMTAADYGLVSAAAGVGALIATFIPLSSWKYLAYAACFAVVVGDVGVVWPLGTELALLFSFIIGFGFNSTRIRIRRGVFGQLRSHRDSALWGGRITVAFRAVNAGLPLVFALALFNVPASFGSVIFPLTGLVVMGIAIPACLLFVEQKSDGQNGAIVNPEDERTWPM